jgi:type II secretory pathway pseudopilin PulG
MSGSRFVTTQVRGDALGIDGATANDQNARSVKPPRYQIAGFSLVEVTLALGVAAICLLAMLGLMPASLNTQQNAVQQTTANQIISQIDTVLRADVRLPPGQENKVCPDPPDPNEPCNWNALNGHWRDRAAPDKLFFTNEGKQTGNIGPDASPPPDAVFRATITYKLPPSETTSLAEISVSWPAAVDPDPPNNGVPAGSVTTTIAANR